MRWGSGIIFRKNLIDRLSEIIEDVCQYLPPDLVHHTRPLSRQADGDSQLPGFSLEETSKERVRRHVRDEETHQPTR